MAGSIGLSFREASHASREQVLICARSRDFVRRLIALEIAQYRFDCSKANAMTLDTAVVTGARHGHQLKHWLGMQHATLQVHHGPMPPSSRSGYEIATAPAAQRPSADLDPALANKVRIDALKFTRYGTHNGYLSRWGAVAITWHATASR